MKHSRGSVITRGNEGLNTCNMTRAQNDTADGYVDPSIPNPNGPGDAPIIIYGYVLVLFIVACSLRIPPLTLFLQLYTHPRPGSSSPRPLRSSTSTPFHSPLPTSPVGVLDPVPSYHCLRNRWLRLPFTILPAPRREPLRRNKLRNPVLLHRRRPRLFLRRYLHYPHFTHCRPRPEPEPAGSQPTDDPLDLRHQ